MSSAQSIAGFDAAGEEYLLPVYDFNARAVSALSKPGCHVMDLGSGTARFLAYLARHRPDLRITGVELSAGMVQVGREMLARSGLDSRVTLVSGDMRDLRHVASEPVDVISSIFSLHHLESPKDLAGCLGEISRGVTAGAALWIFDHARPRRQRTAIEFPSIFTPDSAEAFCNDSSNSLRAAWSYGELESALRTANLVRARSIRSRGVLPLYQIHWIAASRHEGGHANWIAGERLSPATQSEATQFEHLFRFTPQRSSQHTN